MRQNLVLAVVIADTIATLACKTESPRCDCAPCSVDGGTKIDASVDADQSTGIPECDAYVAYFKACTVMIAGWTPASAQAAADVMIHEYTVAGAPAGAKAMTAANCVSEMAAYRKFASATCPDVK